MKLDRLQEYFTVFCVTTAGVLAGIYCGQLAAEGDTKKLGYIGAAIAVMLLCLAMKTRIWILIPLAWDLKGSSFMLPLPFSIREIFIMLCFVTFLIYTALKLIKKRPKHDFLDFIMWLNLAYLLSVYIRNPVGLNSLGNDLVGGRPYYITVVVLLGYWVLSRVTLNVKQAGTIPTAILISATVVSFMSIVAYRFPATVPVLSHIYSGVETSSYDAMEANGEQTVAGGDTDPDAVEGRIGALMDFGVVAIAYLCAFYPPTSLLNPLLFWRFLLFTLAWICILYSGHRIGISLGVATIAISGYFRRGLLELIKVGAFFLPILVVLILGNGTLFELPIVAQRALSFLPGHWNWEAVENANASSEWRFEMWHRAMDGNKYIKNKILGDGFGTSQRAQDSVREMAAVGESGEAGMEGQLINGGFHSGPLTAIRVVGAVGLVLLYAWMIYLVIYAVRLIRTSKDTPFFPIALFFGSGICFDPLFYTFVFGGYDVQLPQMILNTAMLKLISDSLAAYKASESHTGTTDQTRPWEPLHEFIPAGA